MQKNHFYFPFEKLVAYQVAQQVYQQVIDLSASWPRGWADLRDHARRSANSVKLNVAEGASQVPGSGNKSRHFNIALGSAGELHDCLDTALTNRLNPRAKLDAVIALNRRSGSLVYGLYRRCKR